MIDFIKSNKLLTATLLLIAGALVAYNVFFTSAGPTQPLTSSSATGVTSASSPDLLAVLVNLRTLRLDNAVFNNPSFSSLTDFGVTIPPQAPGRTNPFAPYAQLSGVGAVGSTTASTTTLTAPSAAALKLPIGTKKP